MGVSRGVVAVTIPNGAAVPVAGVQLDPSLAITGIEVPASWTAAVLSFQTSNDGGANWVDVYKTDGTEYTITVVSSHHVVVPMGDLLGFTWIKVRSGTGGTPVNQSGAKVIKLMTLPVVN